MQHELNIKKILYQYNYDFSNINFKTNLEDTVDQIRKDLIQKSIGLNESRKIMSSLWTLKKTEKIKNLKMGTLKDILNQIKNIDYYSVKNDFIICHKFISCTAIKHSNIFHILKQDQIKKLIDLGYGINSFRIEIDDNIRELYCDGKHPNLNPSYKTFCFDSDLRNIKFTIENFNLIEQMLSQFNLDSNYMKLNEFNTIMEIINDGEKEKEKENSYC